MPEYELLKAGSCDLPLPLNTVRDEFSFLRFAPLEVPNERGTSRVVIPRDVINPAVMNRVLDDVRRLPYKVPIPAVRGGPGMFRRWDTWTTPVAPEAIQTIDIEDRRQFLRNPTVTIDDVRHDLRLSREQVADLIDRGSTVVTLGSRGDATAVRLRVETREQAGNDDDALPTRIDVAGIHSLLEDPQVTVREAEQFRVNLDNRALGELLASGVTRVTLKAGDRRRPAFLVADASRMSGSGASMGEATSRERGMALGAAAAMQQPPFSAGELERIAEKAAASALPRFELVLALPYRQTWELLGYARGELVNTIALAPQEETTIEVFTWDRRKREADRTTSVEREGMLEISLTDKNTLEVLKEATAQENWKFDAGGDVTIPVQVPIKLDAGYETGASLDQVDRTTKEDIQESVIKASERIKATRQTKVTVTEEFGSESRTTRRIRNPNMCRTLSVDFFEVLATYRVATRLVRDRVQLCVVVPDLMTDEIDRQFLLTWEGVLTDAILSTEHLGGFAAARLLAAADELCDILCHPPCQCESTTPGTTALARIPLPPRLGQPDPATLRADRVVAAAAALSKSLAALTSASTDDFCAIPYSQGLDPTRSPEQRKLDQLEWLKSKAAYHKTLYWRIATEQFPTLGLAADAYLTAAPAAGDTLSAEIAADAIDAFLTATDRTMVDQMVGKLQELVLLPITQIKLALERLSVGDFCLPRLLVEVGIDPAGLPGAIEEARDALDAYRGPATGGGSTPEDGQGGQPANGAQTPPPGGAEFAAGELAKARVAEQALIWHLRANESYYRATIWRSLDPQDRTRLLALYGDLPRHVVPDVLGFLGTAAVLPYRIDDDETAAQWLHTNVMSHTALETPSAPFEVTVPTRGLVTETRLGSCDGCEDYIVKQRALELRLREAETLAAEERAKQEALETLRYQRRLEQSLFDDPDPNASQGPLRIALRQETPPSP